MNATPMTVLRFEEKYFERLWGGDKLKSLFDKDVPEGKPIGEAWLIADHRVHESIIAEGPHQGKTLRQLLETDPERILGTRPQLTFQGRFPLLLKILDAHEVLSVQVHPDDAYARHLGEDDVGKTEMWHVLQADANSELICGLAPSVTPEAFTRAVADGSIEDLMVRLPAREGMSVFVPAGMVHAAGRGVVLVEIQQNSDLTYRIHDWGRFDVNGEPRQLHTHKAVNAVHFGKKHTGVVQPLEYASDGQARCSVLAACRHFATERIEVDGAFRRPVNQQTFHILLSVSGEIMIGDGDSSMPLQPAQALLVPGSSDRFEVVGNGVLLDYYVPDLHEDIVPRLLERGHTPGDIANLGVATLATDIRIL